MRGLRYFLFFLMIAVGIAGGLAYGWVVNPVKYENTSPDKLHPNYKADYVLMVAEIYQADQDLAAAARRLAFLREQSPELAAAQGLLTAREMNYAPTDLELMNQLTVALQGASPTAAPTGQP